MQEKGNFGFSSVKSELDRLVSTRVHNRSHPSVNISHMAVSSSILPDVKCGLSVDKMGQQSQVTEIYKHLIFCQLSILTVNQMTYIFYEKHATSVP